ncbi:MAG: hypothetical protein HOP08_16305 [Cyclobacteriaceae bacterium]|nr:hypothetical protein [Cyclobacteriaceae bacterium]
MSKIIFVLRHAQSAGKQSGQRDYDRLLTAEGEAEAKKSGKYFSEKGYSVDLILCSSAARTRKTIELVNESLQFPADKIQYKEDLYDALLVHLLDTIHTLPDAINNVMLVGHNPGISLLAGDLCGSFMDLSTSQLIGIEFKSNSWEDLNGPGKQILNIK